MKFVAAQQRALIGYALAGSAFAGMATLGFYAFQIPHGFWGRACPFLKRYAPLAGRRNSQAAPGERESFLSIVARGHSNASARETYHAS